VETTVIADQLAELMKQTDVQRLTNRMEELAEPAGSTVLKVANARAAASAGAASSP